MGFVYDMEHGPNFVRLVPPANLLVCGASVLVTVDFYFVLCSLGDGPVISYVIS